MTNDTQQTNYYEKQKKKKHCEFIKCENKIIKKKIINEEIF